MPTKNQTPAPGVTAHTPGPWRAIRIHTPPHFDRGCISIGPNLRGMVSAVQVPELDTAAEANARLIAAAPELLEALEAVRADIMLAEVEGGTSDLAYQVERAIARATGGKS